MSHGHFWNGWGSRARALRNVPLVLRLAWESGPAVVSGRARVPHRRRVAAGHHALGRQGDPRRGPAPVRRRACSGPTSGGSSRSNAGWPCSARILGRDGGLLRFAAGRSLHPPRQRARDGSTPRGSISPPTKTPRSTTRWSARASRPPTASAWSTRSDRCCSRASPSSTLSASIAYFSPWLLAAARARGGAGVPRREPLRVPRLLAQHPADARAAAARLPAAARREQGIGERAEAVRARAVRHGRVRAARPTSSTSRTSRSRGAACCRARSCRVDQHGQLLRRVRVRRLPDGERRSELGRSCSSSPERSPGRTAASSRSSPRSRTSPTSRCS